MQGCRELLGLQATLISFVLPVVAQLVHRSVNRLDAHRGEEFKRLGFVLLDRQGEGLLEPEDESLGLFNVLKRALGSELAHTVYQEVRLILRLVQILLGFSDSRVVTGISPVAKGYLRITG